MGRMLSSSPLLLTSFIPIMGLYGFKTCFICITSDMWLILYPTFSKKNCSHILLYNCFKSSTKIISVFIHLVKYSTSYPCLFLTLNLSCMVVKRSTLFLTGSVRWALQCNHIAYINLFTTIHDGNFRRHSSMNVTIKWHKFSSNIYYIYVFFVIWSWKLR